jgi:hypothetical protein
MFLDLHILTPNPSLIIIATTSHEIKYTLSWLGNDGSIRSDGTLNTGSSPQPALIDQLRNNVRCEALTWRSTRVSDEAAMAVHKSNSARKRGRKDVHTGARAAYPGSGGNQGDGEALSEDYNAAGYHNDDDFEHDYASTEPKG